MDFKTLRSSVRWHWRLALSNEAQAQPPAPGHSLRSIRLMLAARPIRASEGTSRCFSGAAAVWMASLVILDRMTACRIGQTDYAVSTEIDSPNNIPNVQYTICEADCIIKSNSRRTFVTSVKTVLARSRQMRCHSVRSAKIVSDDLLSSIPPLNFPKISGKIAAFFGVSTL